MASTKLTLLSCILLMATLAIPALATSMDDIEVVVEGVVHCQSCKHAGTESFTDSKPIKAAKVSVICKDYKNRVDFYNVYETNEDGYFYAELNGFKMSHPLLEHPLQACKVKLVSSSQENCNIPTNANNGLSGAPLRFDNKVLYRKGYHAVIYETGPFAYRPSYCPKY